MSSPEEVAYPILRKHDVDYVLIIFGGLIGYSGDDINKFLWMVRIAQGVWPDEIQEPRYFTPQGDYRVDDQASTTMKNSLMYKMSYYRCVGDGAPVRAVVTDILLQLHRAFRRWTGAGPRAWTGDPATGTYPRLSR